MRNKLKELKSIYEDLTNKLNNKKSNGNLSIWGIYELDGGVLREEAELQDAEFLSLDILLLTERFMDNRRWDSVVKDTMKRIDDSLDRKDMVAFKRLSREYNMIRERV